MTRPLLVIACGAIASELVRIKRANDWDQLEFRFRAGFATAVEQTGGAIAL